MLNCSDRRDLHILAANTDCRGLALVYYMGLTRRQHIEYVVVAVRALMTKEEGHAVCRQASLLTKFAGGCGELALYYVTALVVPIKLTTRQ